MNDALQQYIESRRRMRFEWGVHDCASFAAGAVDAQCGTDYVATVRAYGVLSARTYRKMLRTGRTLEAMVRDVLGAPESLGYLMQRGDVVLVGRGVTAALALAVPPVLLVAHELGVRPVPIAAGTVVWRGKR